MKHCSKVKYSEEGKVPPCGLRCTFYNSNFHSRIFHHELARRLSQYLDLLQVRRAPPSIARLFHLSPLNPLARPRLAEHMDLVMLRELCIHEVEEVVGAETIKSAYELSEPHLRYWGSIPKVVVAFW